MLSPYLIAALLGWIIAQGSKYIFALIKGRSVRKLQSLYISGGMPSAHSATVTALVSVIGLKNGIDSGLFGLGFVFASVVDSNLLKKKIFSIIDDYEIGRASCRERV